MSRKDRNRRRKRIKARRQLKETQVSKRACSKCGQDTKYIVCVSCVAVNQQSA